MLSYNIYALGIMAAVVSFLGFVVENIWLAMTKGYINNRNMNAPFLLGYGLFVVALYFAVGTPEHMVLLRKFRIRLSKAARYCIYFIIAMIAVSVSEIILGMAVEKMCGFYYWNYASIPLHITRYTSVPTSAAFAVLITFLMGICFEPIMSWISKMDPGLLRVVSVILMVVMMWDFILSFHYMITKKAFHMKWTVWIKKIAS